MDTTQAACERLFELMDNQPSHRHYRNNTEALYDRWMAEISQRVRNEPYVAPSPTDYLWDPSMLAEFYD